MSRPAAKLGDSVTSTDIHIVQVPSPAGPVPTPMSLPFAGPLVGGLSKTVKVDGRPAAVADSYAFNSTPHVGPGPFLKPPSNRATIVASAASVKFDNRPVARVGDTAVTCNDPSDAPNGVVQGTGTVIVGD